MTTTRTKLEILCDNLKRSVHKGKEKKSMDLEEIRVKFNLTPPTTMPLLPRHLWGVL